MAERGAVEVDGQRVAYEWLEVDVRSDQRRQADALAGCLGGEPAVVLPGHGQTVASPAKLTAAAAVLSSASIAWCIDILTPEGGDPVKARALSLIVRERIAALFPPDVQPHARLAQSARTTLVGWSHGGAEALRSAAADPVLFPRVAGLCPAGLIERRPLELLTSFLSEVMRIGRTVLVRRSWSGVRDGLRVGFDILRGIALDLIRPSTATGLRSGSVSRVTGDIRWASRKVPGAGFAYGGEVALVFARDDTVIRWQAVFPACAAPAEIPAHLEDYRRTDFPKVSRLQVAVLEGDHLSPESEAAVYAEAAFGLLSR
jgi:pimeloyl-ACP methyl ester carboxylesterase